MMLASGGADEEVTWLDGEAAMAASVAVKSSGTAELWAGAWVFAATGGAVTASLSRECRQEHPETVTEATSRPAAMRIPKNSFETMLHSDALGGLPSESSCYTGTGLSGTRFNVNFVRPVTGVADESYERDTGQLRICLEHWTEEPV